MFSQISLQIRKNILGEVVFFPIAEYRGVRRSLFFGRGVVESISWSRGVMESWSRFWEIFIRLTDFIESTPRLHSVDSTTSLSRLHDFAQSTPRLHSVDSTTPLTRLHWESTVRLHWVDSTTPLSRFHDSTIQLSRLPLLHRNYKWKVIFEKKLCHAINWMTK